jgi:hypothetical protein
VLASFGKSWPVLAPVLQHDLLLMDAFTLMKHFEMQILRKTFTFEEYNFSNRKVTSFLKKNTLEHILI